MKHPSWKIYVISQTQNPRIYVKGINGYWLLTGMAGTTTSLLDLVSIQAWVRVLQQPIGVNNNEPRMNSWQNHWAYPRRLVGKLDNKYFWLRVFFLYQNSLKQTFKPSFWLQRLFCNKKNGVISGIQIIYFNHL